MPDTPSQTIAKSMIARFPVTHANLQYTNVTGGSHPYDIAVEDIKVSINKLAPDDQIGRLDAIVKLHSGSDTSGFKGGAYYRLLDDKGNVVWAILGKRDSVNGKLIPGKPSRIDIIESENIPVDVLTAVYAIEIYPTRMEDDSLQNIKDTIEKLRDGAKAVQEGIKNIGASVAEIIAALKAL